MPANVGVAWNVWAVPGTLAGLLAWALAAFVYFARPGRATNRLLALVLVFEGIGVFGGAGIQFFMTRPEDAYASQFLSTVSSALLPVLYFAFLGATLSTPLVRPFRSRAVIVTLAALSFGILVYAILVPRPFVSGVYHPAFAPWNSTIGPAGALLVLLTGAIAIFALVASLDTWRRAARGTVERSRAGWFAVGFAVHDIFVGGTLALFSVIRPIPFWGDFVYNPGFGFAVMASHTMLAYAMARHQIFDIELRVQRTVQRAAVVAAFVALYLVVSQTATVFLAPRLGAVLGIAAAAALALAIIPLYRMAGRAAARMLPSVSATQLEARKREVYRGALEQVVPSTGEIADADARFLAELRAQLGLTTGDHLAADLEVRARFGLPGGIVAGRYRLGHLLGRGAAGEVFHAFDTREKREVALKRVDPRLRRDAAAAARFREEAAQAAAARHQGVVELLGIEDVAGELWLVMEYMPGGSLEDRLRAAPVKEAEAIRMARDLLAALAVLHERGIVHRDVKPSNVLLTAEGRAKLSDFSVARAVVSGDTVGFAGAPAVGTPAYMAPEQARGLPATPRSDLFSLGATLYAALTGKPPVAVDGLSEFEARLRVASEAPALPLRGVSPSMNAALAKALARDPSERYASADDMLRDLAT